MGESCTGHGHEHARDYETEGARKIHISQGKVRQAVDAPAEDHIADGGGECNGQAERGGGTHAVAPRIAGPCQKDDELEGTRHAGEAGQNVDGDAYRNRACLSALWGRGLKPMII